MLKSVQDRFVPLPRSFYDPSAREVAPLLLGQWLLRRGPGGYCGGPIVETEAYLDGDPACHASRGCTPRNRVMFGPPGHSYVYFIYGCHYCFNAVCRPAGVPEAVLVRAIEAVFELKWMEHRRGARKPVHLTNGPGKLCAAMAITRELDGVDLCNPESPVVIARNPEAEAFRRERGPIVSAPRIGITAAVDLPLRFYLRESEFVSRKGKMIRVS